MLLLLRRGEDKLRIRFRESAVIGRDGAWRPIHFDVIEEMAERGGVGGWHLNYVFQGDKCIYVEAILDEEAEFTVGGVTKKVRDVLRERGKTIRDIVDELKRRGIVEITIEE